MADLFDALKGEFTAVPLRTLVPDHVVREIRELYATGSYTQRELAAEFDINQSEVSRLINFKRRSTV